MTLEQIAKRVEMNRAALQIKFMKKKSSQNEYYELHKKSVSENSGHQEAMSPMTKGSVNGLSNKSKESDEKEKA